MSKTALTLLICLTTLAALPGCAKRCGASKCCPSTQKEIVAIADESFDRATDGFNQAEQLAYAGDSAENEENVLNLDDTAPSRVKF